MDVGNLAFSATIRSDDIVLMIRVCGVGNFERSAWTCNGHVVCTTYVRGKIRV